MPARKTRTTTFWTVSGRRQVFGYLEVSIGIDSFISSEVGDETLTYKRDMSQHQLEPKFVPTGIKVHSLG